MRLHSFFQEGRMSRRTGWLVVGILILLMAWSGIGAASDYVLKDMGSFHVGGRQVTLKDLPVKEIVFSAGAPAVKVDPNGDFEVEQMYVQYFIPADQKSKYPLLMWHGGGLTGVTWESKPDGQPGWMQYFLKTGHAVYVSDAMERGAPLGRVSRKFSKANRSSGPKSRHGSSSVSDLRVPTRPTPRHGLLIPEFFSRWPRLISFASSPSRVGRPQTRPSRRPITPISKRSARW